MPLIDPKQFVGGMYDPIEGHLDPYGVTHAYAKAARKNGATYFTNTKVESLSQEEDGMDCRDQSGVVRAEHVVNCGGLWAREVGRMVGLELPVLAMEHMYLLTEDMPEVKEINEKTGKEVIHVVDFDGELYLRQERGGMLMGTYERACVPGRNARPHGALAMNSLSPILNGSRRHSKWASNIFRHLKKPGSSRSSMALHLCA